MGVHLRFESNETESSEPFVVFPGSLPDGCDLVKIFSHPSDPDGKILSRVVEAFAQLERGAHRGNS